MVGCSQHEKLLVSAGFDDVTAFAAFSESDVNVMHETLSAAGVPVVGHLIKIMRAVRMRAVRGCQDYEQRAGPSPLTFDYSNK